MKTNALIHLNHSWCLFPVGINEILGTVAAIDETQGLSNGTSSMVVPVLGETGASWDASYHLSCFFAKGAGLINWFSYSTEGVCSCDLRLLIDWPSLVCKKRQRGFLPCWPNSPGLSIRELRALSPTQEAWKLQKGLTSVLTPCTKISKHLWVTMAWVQHPLPRWGCFHLYLFRTETQELSLKGTNHSICSSCAFLALRKYLLK